MTESSQGNEALTPTRHKEHPAAPDGDVPWLVAVGASAGGLEALQRFFGAIDGPTHAAFVVIQHLAPDHRSMMAELLTRHTTMPVHEARSGEPVVAEQVYLMPPGVSMTLQGDRLVMAPRAAQGVPLPIDQFFGSLALARPQHAVAVVLSGSGSDGAAGAEAVRTAGGYVMAQSIESAKFDSMPRSVQALGRVDAVGTPEELANHVLRFTRGQAGREMTSQLMDAARTRPALDRLFDSLLAACGIDFSQYKLPTLMRRIERRLMVTGCSSVNEYADRVAGDPQETELLRGELLIPVTGFFRDPAAFDSLRAALEKLLLQREDKGPLRLWCAGCATGEEAYSLLIVALEACLAVQRWPGVKVFATDVDGRLLQVGSEGAYPIGAAVAIEGDRLSQHFTAQEERLWVKPELRQMVLFARHNLLDDAPFTRIDLVSCRNTLIYLRPEAQERVMRRLQYALNPGGLMFLGSSESIGALAADFQVLDAASKLYRLLRPVLTSVAVRDGFGRYAMPQRVRSGPLARAAGNSGSVVDAALEELVQSYVPVSLLVTAQRQLLHVWGPAERFLRVGRGQPQLDVTRLLPGRLGAVVGHALHGALREPRKVVVRRISLVLDGDRLELQVRAKALLSPEGEVGPALVTFEPAAPAAAPAVDAFDEPPEHLDRIATLEREIAETRLSLQAHLEEVEATNEELQAANEELMSSNEELQSTNEELQSVNEELYTVNAEYNAKLQLITELNADLDGMSQATGIATLFVDAGLALVRFTPEAMTLFRLRPDDTGRSIADFNHVLDYPLLLSDLHEALAGGTVIEREVAGPGGSRYLARTLGYGGVGAPDRRAVLSLVDVSRLHEARQTQTLIDSLPEHVALLDAEGTIRQVNRAWKDFALANGGDPARSGVGVSYLATLARASDEASMRLLRSLQKVLQGELDRVSETYPCHSPQQQRWFVVHANALADSPPGEPRGAVVTHFEITPWHGKDGVH